MSLEDHVNQALEHLNSRRQVILRTVYGLEEAPESARDELAALLKLSPRELANEESEALRQLRYQSSRNWC